MTYKLLTEEEYSRLVRNRRVPMAMPQEVDFEEEDFFEEEEEED